VVRPMSVIGRFSIMPSWKDDGQVGEYRPEDESGRSQAYWPQISRC
jgi:hypothetical protein